MNTEKEKPKCRCGKTSDAKGYCDGSHANKALNKKKS